MGLVNMGMLESIWGTEISLSICVLNMGSNAPYCSGNMGHYESIMVTSIWGRNVAIWGNIPYIALLSIRGR